MVKCGSVKIFRKFRNLRRFSANYVAALWTQIDFWGPVGWAEATIVAPKHLPMG